MSLQQAVIRSLSILLVGLFIMPAALWGQRGDRPEHPPKPPDSEQITKMVDDMAEALSLSEEQKTKVSDLHLTHFKEVEDLMMANEETRKKHRSEMESQRKEFQEQITDLLTDEQKSEFEKFMKNRRHGKEHRNRDHR